MKLIAISLPTKARPTKRRESGFHVGHPTEEANVSGILSKR